MSNDAMDAIAIGDATALIASISEIADTEEIKQLIDMALDIGDDAALWYIIASTRQYWDDAIDIEAYTIERCRILGRTLPCESLGLSDQPLDFLRLGIIDADRDRTLYALDRIYAPLNPYALADFSTEDYSRLQQYDTEFQDIAFVLLMQAKPSFLRSLIEDLPPPVKAEFTGQAAIE